MTDAPAEAVAYDELEALPDVIMRAETGPDLLAELDAMNCWCGRDEEECEDLGGCRWTRELARVRAQGAQAAYERILDLLRHPGSLPGERAPREHATAYTVRALKRWLRDQPPPAGADAQGEAMIKNMLTPLGFSKALADAGIFTEDELLTIERIVIVAEPQSLVTMHIQRAGDERLLDIVPLLLSAQHEPPQPAGADGEPGERQL